MARQKRLKPLEQYLAPLKPKKKGSGIAEVAAFLDRKIIVQQRDGAAAERVGVRPKAAPERQER